MIKKFKKVVKVFFAWQDDKEEIWLREMAQKGWVLENYTFLTYTFYKSETKDYIYKLDYKRINNSEMGEYLKIFEDAGWEHVAEFLGWHYFRSEADECLLPEIYSDTNSKVQKYKSLLGILIPVTILNIINLLNMTINPVYWHLNSLWGIRGLLIAVVSLLVLADIKLILKIKKLRESSSNL